MQGMPLAHHVARALHPFLTGDDVPDVPTLTDMIAAAGTQEVARQVAALYAAVPSVDAEAVNGGE